MSYCLIRKKNILHFLILPILLFASMPQGYAQVQEKEDSIIAPNAKKAARLQNRYLSGKVVDTNGSPLPGVNIQTNDPQISGISGSDGSFHIAIP